MKKNIAYIIVFLLAFIATTGTIIYLNSVFENIFAFDFKPIQQKTEVHTGSANNNINMAELKSVFRDEIKKNILDSLRVLSSGGVKTDTVVKKVVQDSALVDSLKAMENKLKYTTLQLSKQETESKDAQTEAVKQKQSDSTYTAWTQRTAKVYEAMDPQRAAKIISNYSDNIARDLIYSMRQKNAAAILSELNPETANRIMSTK